VFTARYGLSAYTSITEICFVFKRLKCSLNLSTSKLGIKSLGNAAVSSVSNFTKIHSAIFKLLLAQKKWGNGRTDGRMDGRSDFNKFVEGLQKSLKYFFIGRLKQ
jgi:hypothetical protein